jgi:2-(3-amino-3-carboxypropyl)histidine synthase
MKKTILELEKEYDLELDRIIKQIKTSKAKLVLLQFPEGLKPYAIAVVDFLEEKTNGKTEFLIWLESCYGTCDTPVLSKKIEKQVDLVVQFGHNEMMPSY